MAHISYFTAYGYTNGLTSASLTVKDEESSAQTQFELSDEERVELSNLLWDIIERRKHDVARCVRDMQRPLLVNHSDGKTISVDNTNSTEW